MPTPTEDNFADAVDLWGRLVRATNFVLDDWWLWPLIGVALWIVLGLRSQHALLAQLDERAGAAFGDVDALISERHALIGNLAQVVKAFATKEHDVIRDVLDARVASLEALGDGAVRTDTQVASVLQNVFSMSEAYPKLASAEHYTNLRAELVRIEDRIAAARRFYNLAVEELNSVRRAFPGNLFALFNKAGKREKFSLGDRRVELDEPARISL
jgi:LemA protein